MTVFDSNRNTSLGKYGSVGRQTDVQYPNIYFSEPFSRISKSSLRLRDHIAWLLTHTYLSVEVHHDITPQT
jgi:hypothetical protein